MLDIDGTWAFCVIRHRCAAIMSQLQVTAILRSIFPTFILVSSFVKTWWNDFEPSCGSAFANEMKQMSLNIYLYLRMAGEKCLKTTFLPITQKFTQTSPNFWVWVYPYLYPFLKCLGILIPIPIPKVNFPLLTSVMRIRIGHSMRNMQTLRMRIEYAYQSYLLDDLTNWIVPSKWAKMTKTACHTYDFHFPKG